MSLPNQVSRDCEAEEAETRHDNRKQKRTAERGREEKTGKPITQEGALVEEQPEEAEEEEVVSEAAEDEIEDPSLFGKVGSLLCCCCCLLSDGCTYNFSK